MQPQTWHIQRVRSKIYIHLHHLIAKHISGMRSHLRIKLHLKLFFVRFLALCCYLCRRYQKIEIVEVNTQESSSLEKKDKIWSLVASLPRWLSLNDGKEVHTASDEDITSSWGGTRLMVINKYLSKFQYNSFVWLWRRVMARSGCCAWPMSVIACRENIVTTNS